MNNAALLEEIIASKARLKENPALTVAEAMTPKLAQMIWLMVERYATKGSWSGYSYLEELKGSTLLLMCEKWVKYDETRTPANPFAFYTTVITNGFRAQLDKEKRPQKIRDAVLTTMGLSPSYGAQLEYEAEQAGEPLPPAVEADPEDDLGD